MALFAAGGQEAAKPAAPAIAVSPAGTFPIVKDKVTLTFLLASTNGVSDYVNNEFTKWLEDKTNIHLEFDIAPTARAERLQKLNLVLASGKLPDIIMNFGIPLDQQQTLADQGLIIPLDDLIAKYGDEFAKVMKEYPQIKDVLTLSDGKLYAMPTINDCYHCGLAHKAWIYQPWLDKLGLKMPTTTDELEQVLLAFKTKDPNGNGKADEIPWSAAQTGSWNAELDQFIMNSFVYNSSLGTSSTKHMFVENGKVKLAYAEPGWKEGLLFLNKLYKQGLIDPQSFTNDGTMHKAVAENPNANIMGFTQAGWPGMFLDWMGKSNRWQEYVPVPPLKGPSGLQQTPMNLYGFGSTGRALISKTSKYPEAAYRLIDLMYSYEATMRSVVGRPGTEWVESKPGAGSITGSGTPRYKVQVIWSEGTQAITWNQAAPTYRSNEFRLEWQEFNPKDPLERSLYQWSKNIYAPYGKPMDVPPLAFNSEQSKQLGTLFTSLSTYSDQMFASFVTGQADINKGWDKYLADLKTNGLDDFLKIYQTAYDAKFKKK
jgi:putative aldouronate transport system substrate-binding protein